MSNLYSDSYAILSIKILHIMFLNELEWPNFPWMLIILYHRLQRAQLHFTWNSCVGFSTYQIVEHNSYQLTLNILVMCFPLYQCQSLQFFPHSTLAFLPQEISWKIFWHQIQETSLIFQRQTLYVRCGV